MAGILKRIWRMMNGDLLGREEVVEKDHPDLGPMVYFGRKGQSDGYWEVELEHPSLAEKFSVILPASKSGPELAQVEFVRSTVRDLDGLFSLCRSSFQAELPKWTKEPWPEDWKSAFVLDGLEVPGRGERRGRWHVCYFAKPANHFFTAHFENGAVREVVVDG
jgi:hypothetical protein